MSTPTAIRVTVWNENRHERQAGHPAQQTYPNGIHKAIAEYLNAQQGLEVRTATLDEPEHGLTGETLVATDVLIWWGHGAHEEVSDAVVERVCVRVLGGMGFIALHSSHFSKPFRRLMGTSCDLKWREGNDHERLWVVNPAHPIVEGLEAVIELGPEEMYGEYFDIPAPDELVFISWFTGGEVFRSGCCYTCGRGRVFYFRPGHETYPTYYNNDIRKIIANAVRWAAPTRGPVPEFGRVDPREPQA